MKAIFISQVLFFRQKQKFLPIENLFPAAMAFLLVYLSQFYIYSLPTNAALLLSPVTYPLPRIPVG